MDTIFNLELYENTDNMLCEIDTGMDQNWDRAAKRTQILVLKSEPFSRKGNLNSTLEPGDCPIPILKNMGCGYL